MLIPIRNSLSVCPAETNKIEACLYTDFPLDFPLKHTIMIACKEVGNIKSR